MYRVGRIEFHGNSRYRDQDLRQYLGLAEGEPFTPRGLEASAQSLMRLGSFRSVQPEVKLVSALLTAEIAFHLDEIPKFEYLIGGNANPTQGRRAVVSSSRGVSWAGAKPSAPSSIWGIVSRISRWATWIHSRSAGRFPWLWISHASPSSFPTRRPRTPMI